MTIYFDNSATTAIDSEVFKSMIPFLTEEYGNPSSLYHIGRNAKKAIEKAREQVANLINADKNEIYFTSCGTESDNTAIKGTAYANKSKGNHIITTKIEHHAILESCKNLEKKGFRVTYLNVDREGIVDLQELEDSITDETILISVMTANNEIGTVQPIEYIAKIAKKHNIIFHTDSVQAIGNIHIDVKQMGIDMLSMSGHKIYGPKGVGVLYVRKGINFDEFMNGGHQERGKRAGTENLASIIGIGKACKLCENNFENHINNITKLRNYCIEKINENIEGVKINGSMENRLPGNINLSFRGVEASGLLLELDKKGICVSAGSACNSNESTPSHVLTAIGLSAEEAKSTIRISIGKFNTKWEVDFLVQNLKEIIQRLRLN